MMPKRSRQPGSLSTSGLPVPPEKRQEMDPNQSESDDDDDEATSYAQGKARLMPAQECKINSAISVAAAADPSSSRIAQTSSKRLLITFKRARFPEVSDLVDMVSAKAYLITEEQKKQYNSYAAKKRKNSKSKVGRVMKKHSEAVGRSFGFGPGSSTSTAMAVSKKKKKSRASLDQCDEEDEEDRERRDEEAILGQAIGSAHGWIFYQDAPCMRDSFRREVMDCVDAETLQLSMKLMGPNNTSRVTSCPDLANGALLVVHFVRLQREHRGHGLGMRLCAELLRHLQPYWSRAILLPVILNSDRPEGMTYEAYRCANQRLSAAFQTVGFSPLGSTEYLYQEQTGFEARLPQQWGNRHGGIPLDLAPASCNCAEGVSDRMRHAIRVPADTEYVTERESVLPGDIKLKEFGTIYAHRFLPPSMTDDKAHLKGFLHIVGTIGMLGNQGTPPSPANVFAALEQGSFPNFIDADGPALCRDFLSYGGHVLDALDMVLYKAKERIELREDSAHGEDYEDPRSPIFLDENLPRCREHDDDYEGLRHRWWREAGRPAHQRGPYHNVWTDDDDGDGECDPEIGNYEEAGQADSVPRTVWDMFMYELGDVTEWATAGAQSVTGPSAGPSASVGVGASTANQ